MASALAKAVEGFIAAMQAAREVPPRSCLGAYVRMVDELCKEEPPACDPRGCRTCLSLGVKLNGSRMCRVGRLVTCDRCATPHPLDDDDAPCLFPKGHDSATSCTGTAVTP